MSENYIYVKENKNMTFESLTAVFYMLTAKTKEDFCKFYKMACHDDNGASIWYWIQQFEPKKKKAVDL